MGRDLFCKAKLKHRQFEACFLAHHFAGMMARTQNDPLVVWHLTELQPLEKNGYIRHDVRG